MTQLMVPRLLATWGLLTGVRIVYHLTTYLGRLIRPHDATLDHPISFMCEGEERSCSGMQGVEW